MPYERIHMAFSSCFIFLIKIRKEDIILSLEKSKKIKLGYYINEDIYAIL